MFTKIFINAKKKVRKT